MQKLHRESRVFSFLSGALAFVLSAVLCVGFVMLVEKTHDLLSGRGVRKQTLVGAARLQST